MVTDRWKLKEINRWDLKVQREFNGTTGECKESTWDSRKNEFKNEEATTVNEEQGKRGNSTETNKSNKKIESEKKEENSYRKAYVDHMEKLEKHDRMKRVSSVTRYPGTKRVNTVSFEANENKDRAELHCLRETENRKIDCFADEEDRKSSYDDVRIIKHFRSQPDITAADVTYEQGDRRCKVFESSSQSSSEGFTYNSCKMNERNFKRYYRDFRENSESSTSGNSTSNNRIQSKEKMCSFSPSRTLRCREDRRKQIRRLAKSETIKTSACSLCTSTTSSGAIASPDYNYNHPSQFHVNSRRKRTQYSTTPLSSSTSVSSNYYYYSTHGRSNVNRSMKETKRRYSKQTSSSSFLSTLTSTSISKENSTDQIATGDRTTYKPTKYHTKIACGKSGLMTGGKNSRGFLRYSNYYEATQEDTRMRNGKRSGRCYVAKYETSTEDTS